ncbi:LysR substrate-binding domain-containing protein [Acinetobacter bereziniae]|uniref:LysR substrate-binding domain-containing protein n=1 Tax=Acinetobacter bereziniae NIPH 3 TaxID=1217651 RepID=N8YKW1_ACIBZ|nr:hypothetical protein F963_03945 [Acinetobacter bereziniae NIPH 3]
MSVILHKLERTVLKTRAQQEKQAVSIICTQAVAHHWLFPRIVKFNQKYPDIMVRVISNNGINELSCNESDFGILYGNGNWPSLDHAPLFPEIVYPICKYNFEIKKPQTLKNIAALPLIQLDSRKWDCIDWRDWFWHFNIDYITPQNALTFNEVTLSFNAAIEGLGVCLGWDFMVKSALEKKLIERFGQFEFNTKKFDYLVHTKNKPLSKTAIIFREWLLNSI